jgi:hypothetical protein
MSSRVSTDRIAFDPLTSQARMQDIELARVSQGVLERFYKPISPTLFLSKNPPFPDDSIIK